MAAFLCMTLRDFLVVLVKIDMSTKVHVVKSNWLYAI